MSARGRRGGVAGWSERGRAGEWRIPENCLPVLSAVEISQPLGARDCGPLLLGKRGPSASAGAWEMDAWVSRGSAPCPLEPRWAPSSSPELSLLP